MHPAFSVIVFTTASGAGYGLLALTGLVFAAGGFASMHWGFGFCAIGLGTALVAGGLVSSTLHLGRPERALRALTQVRTSWLSREGALAALAFLPILGFFAGWVLMGRIDGPVRLAALAVALLSVATVHATAMIYRSLKPVHQWCNGHVVPVYHVLAAMTGALLLNALAHLWGAPSQALAAFALLSCVAGAFMKERYWRFVDEDAAASTPETATGLAGLGKVRLLDPPHTGSNYVMREMGFRVARKHALKLRRAALVLGFVLPALLLLAAVLLAPVPAAIAATLAPASALAGVLAERWLFFAEAKHSVSLYYGAEAA